MSSVSSHDGSEKDGFLHRMPDGFPHRYSSMRKTDLLDTFDSVRHRDTDTWSVAATIDDQESVISGPGGTASLISSSRATAEGRETDDDRSTLDGISETARDMHPALLLGDNTSSSASFRLEALRDLDGPLLHHDNASSITTDDDKRSRSNAAEFGDEGTRSATADFGDSSDTSDDETEGQAMHHHHHHHHHHNVVNDDISAPPQPQPSFASVTKSFAEIMEENEVLHNQLRNLQIAQKHQSEVIENLRSLTGCNEEIYGRALHLSQVTPEELDRWNEQGKSIGAGGAGVAGVNVGATGGAGAGAPVPSSAASVPSRPVSASYSHHSTTSATNTNPATTAANPTSSGAPNAGPIATAAPISATPAAYDMDHTMPNSRSLTQQLARLAELVIRFVQVTVPDETWRPTLEQFLFSQITDAYLVSLPFGTENQDLLNLAYADQIRRFQTTLGANFAKWYRRQTVQSLSLNPATKGYLEMLRAQMTEKLETMLTEGGRGGNKMVNGSGGDNEDHATTIIEHRSLWNEVLDQCTVLSLVIHGCEADVSVQAVAVGAEYDEHVMAVVGDVDHADKDKTVKMVISPLFIDEEQIVLLPARVLLQ
ncbi:hypothetical protein BDB00DRAFT_819435 [Zychaea mexicana]|uniref:uncharacterized protein n=1 Tax=Zychaea mexicana TaxID=64656 RepID=UPI0022FE8DCE|nr:uncharacterized protein BDB00DRAFT_819435 [Zychaea mexicana]KAI9494257.1 hypothetical protein BDB00DRAFT_819435 [Zychaea mexicana]